MRSTLFWISPSCNVLRANDRSPFPTLCRIPRGWQYSFRTPYPCEGCSFRQPVGLKPPVPTVVVVPAACTCTMQVARWGRKEQCIALRLQVISFSNRIDLGFRKRTNAMWKPHRCLYPSDTPTDLRILLHCLVHPGSAKHIVRPSATNTGDRGRAHPPEIAMSEIRTSPTDYRALELPPTSSGDPRSPH